MNNAQILTIIGLSCVSAAAHADFVTPTDFGWDRLSPNSAYFEWDDFTSAAGGNTPDVGMYPSPTPSGWIEPDVIETTGTGFITSTGNIYSFSAATEFEVTYPNLGLGSRTFDTTVLVQIRTQGSELDTESIQIGGITPAESIELDRIDLGGGSGAGGFQVDTLFRFELSGNLDSYLLEFAAVASSMSLDKLAIDTVATSSLFGGPFSGDITNASGARPVPTPASGSLLGLGLLVVTRRRR